MKNTRTVKTALKVSASRSSDIIDVPLSAEHLVRLSEVAKRSNQSVEELIRIATERYVSAMEAASPDPTEMSAAMTLVEEKIELLKTCGEELIERVSSLVHNLDEDEINSVVFLFRPMHEAFSSQLRQAFDTIHHLSLREQKSASAPARAEMDAAFDGLATSVHRDKLTAGKQTPAPSLAAPEVIKAVRQSQDEAFNIGNDLTWLECGMDALEILTDKASSPDRCAADLDGAIFVQMEVKEKIEKVQERVEINGRALGRLLCQIDPECAQGNVTGDAKAEVAA